MSYLLPHEQELLDTGAVTLDGLVAQYRVMFTTCWDVMTAEQQTEVHEVLRLAGLIREGNVDG